MNSKILLPALITWLVLAALGFANGAFRALALLPNLDVSEANVVSVVISAGLILLGTRVFVGIVKDRSTPKDMLLVGLLWVVLGVASETGIGLAHGASLKLLLQAYNVSQGRLWIVLPLTQLIAPFIMYRLLKR